MLGESRLYLAPCVHTFDFYPINPESEGQEISPSHPITYTYIGFNAYDSSCILSIISDRIQNWWGLLRTATSPSATQGTPIFTHRTPIFCNGHSEDREVLTPGENLTEYCNLDSDTWSSMVSLVLDALVQTGEMSGATTQVLLAHVESISTQRW